MDSIAKSTVIFNDVPNEKLIRMLKIADKEGLVVRITKEKS